MKHSLPLCALLLVLSGCASVSPLTALRLARLSPLTADPAAIALHVRVPRGVRLRPGSARMVLSVEGPETLTRALPVTAQGDSALELSLSPQAVTELRAVQARAAEWRAQGVAVHGSLGLSLGFCALGEGPAPDSLVDADVRLAPEGDFLPLVRSLSLREILARPGAQPLMPCDGSFEGDE